MRMGIAPAPTRSLGNFFPSSGVWECSCSADTRHLQVYTRAWLQLCCTECVCKTHTHNDVQSKIEHGSARHVMLKE